MSLEAVHESVNLYGGDGAQHTSDLRINWNNEIKPKGRKIILILNKLN